MKAKEIRTKQAAEMQRDLTAMREKLRELRFKLHSQELKNPKEIAALKKDIARTMTIINQN